MPTSLMPKRPKSPMASPDELWLVDFGEPFPGEPAHRRPALVLGPPATFGAEFPYVLVCPLTRTDRELSLHVEVQPDQTTGLDAVSWVQSESIRSINRRRLVARLGRIGLAESDQVRDIVGMLLGR